VVFYARTSEDSGVEIIAVGRTATGQLKQFIFRLNDAQSINLANDLSAIEFKLLKALVVDKW